MSKHREDNPFEDPVIAGQWISSVENEKDLFRDKEIYPRLNRWYGESRPKAVLEIGSGQGICSSRVSLKGSEYVGVEPSATLLKRAGELYGKAKVKFIEGNAYALPVADGSFEGVFSVVVWLHLENLLDAARELSRVLKPGGSFYIITANPQAYPAWEALFEEPKKSGKRIEGKVSIPGNPLNRNVIYFHSEKELMGSFSAAGLKAKISERFGSSVEAQSADYFVAIEGSKP